MESPRSSLLIPAFNEAERLATGLERLRVAALEGKLSLDDLRVMILDDGSSDDTAELAKLLIKDLPHGILLQQPNNMGKGAAILAGVRAASTPLLAFVDADFSIDPRQLPALLESLKESPLAIGSRSIAGHVDYGSWLRTYAGRSFNRLIRVVSKVNYPDTQCGFKAIRTAHAKILFHFNTIHGFAFDVELLARAQSFGWNVCEVPVSWRDIKGSRVRLAKDSLLMLSELARARQSFSQVPPLWALPIPSRVSEQSLRNILQNSPLSHSPVMSLASGELMLVAAMFTEAEAREALGELSLDLGTEPRPLRLLDIQDAPVNEIMLLEEQFLLRN